MSDGGVPDPGRSGEKAPPGAGHGNGRRLDPVGVAAALRRLARAGEPPWLHREVGRRLGERLAVLRARPTRIVDWWSWLGAGGEVLDAAYPLAERTAVEPDARFAALSDRARSGARPWWSLGRAKVPRAKVDSGGGIGGGDGYDGYGDGTRDGDRALGPVQVVWANMVLHAVVDPPALFERWQALLEVDGFVVFSCLGPGSLTGLRDLYARCGWPSPTPGFIDMHDLGDMLVAAGFAEPVLDQETIELRWRSPEALLAELHGLGGNAAPDRHPGLRTPRWRDRLLAEIGRDARADGSVGLAFEVAYGHGFKTAPRLGSGEPVTVSLGDMRAMVRKGRRGTAGSEGGVR